MTDAAKPNLRGLSDEHDFQSSMADFHSLCEQLTLRELKQLRRIVTHALNEEMAKRNLRASWEQVK